jgi:fructose-1,6-bisphosphatase/inositol monophosphatase family enzyme
MVRNILAKVHNGNIDEVNNKFIFVEFVSQVHDAHENDFKATIESHASGHDTVTEEITLNAIGEDHGRLSIHSNLHDRESKYNVLSTFDFFCVM